MRGAGARGLWVVHRQARPRRTLLLAVCLALGLAPTVPGGARLAAAGVAPGTEIDVTSCMWQDAQWNGPDDGFGGIDRFAFYALQYLRARVSGGHFRFRGEFPRARYIGFQSYDESGNIISFTADRDMAPDEGSVNPFREGVAYEAGRVSYTLNLRSPR